MLMNLGLKTLARYLANTWRVRTGQKPRGRKRPALRIAVEALECRQMLTNFIVTTALDDSTADSVLSLREAITAANITAGADTITFDSSLTGQRLLLTQGQLVISDPLTITGLGATNTVIDAQLFSRAINITSTAGNVTLESLTVTAGKTEADSARGAGINSTSAGTLTLIDVAVTANVTTGGNSQGGGIFSQSGAVILLDSTVSGNTTAGPNSPGAGISTASAPVTLINSTISGNVTLGGNSGGGGIATYNGNIKLTNTTVAFNQTSGSGSPAGGIFSNGLGGAVPTNIFAINNSIVAKNTASSSTAVDISKGTGTSSVTVNNSLIGVNTGSGLTAAPLGTPDANGNLIGTTAVPIDPKLDVLASNGGTTRTHALLTTSPAIDAGNNSLAIFPDGTALTLDQAGQLRIFHTTVDMGSFELQQAAAVPTVSFSLASQNAGEGAGVFSLIVNLSAATTKNVSIPYTVSGTATNGADYTIVTSPLVISAGATSGTIQVTINNDTLVEGNETVIVTLGTPTNATLGSPSVETLTITDNDNGAPTNITLSSNTVAENVTNTLVGTLTATDPNPGDTATFTIQAGGEGSLFTISGNQLRVGSTGLNYEALSSGAASVTVRATDSTGLFLDKIFSITVTDVNETPAVASGQVFSVVEASANGTVVGTVVATDPDLNAPNKTLTYSITSGNTNNAFAINSATGQITVVTPSALNTATKPQFVLQVQVADGGSPSLSVTQSVTINVTDANDAPTVTAGQVFTTAENRANGSVVGTVAATDPDPTAPNKTLTYSILNGNTNSAFAIDSSTGQLTINATSAINFETKPQFVLTIQVTDGGTPALSDTDTVTINITDANDAPVVPAGQVFTITQNAPVNTVVGTVSASDPDASAPNNTLTFSITSGNTGSAFVINSSTGQITVNNPAALNPNIVPQFTLQIRVADGGNPSLVTTQTVTVNVTAANQAPSIPAGQVFSVVENTSANTAIGTVVATDPDTTAPNKTLTYSITGGNTNSAFAINSSTGQLTVNTASAVDFETTPQFTLQIQVADGGNPSLTATQNVTVNVTNVNEAPVVAAGQSFSVNEHAANSTVVGTVVATDPDLTAPNKTLTYSIVSGNTNTAFAINASTGQITVANSSALSFTVASSFSLSVKAADGGNPSLSSTQTVTISLVDANETPSIAAGQSFTIADNVGSNFVVGTVLATDPDATAPNKTLAYSIVSGNTGNAFTINSTTGQITVLTPGALNSTTTPQYSLQVQVADGGNPSLTATQIVTINVIAPNRAPTIPAGQNFSIPENSTASTVVGNVVANDPDTVAPNNSLFYSIIGGNTNNAFAINTLSGQITVISPAALNYELTQTFSLQVRVTDGGNPSLSATQIVTIHVTDVNETPAIPLNQVFSIAENSATGTTVGTVQAADPDIVQPNNVLTYSILSGNTNNAFAINSATGQLTVNNSSALNFANGSSFSLQVRVADGGAVPLTATQTVTVNLIDINEGPSITAGQTFSVVENLTAGSAVGTVLAGDPDATVPNKTLTYTIFGGNANNAFAINAATGQLTVSNASAVNFEATQQFVLQVNVADGGNPSLSATQAVTINVTDVNEVPNIAAGQTFAVAEQAGVDTVVGTVLATDPDTVPPANNLSYAIVGGNTSNAFTINTATGQITVNNPAALNTAVNPTFALQVRVTDAGSPSLNMTQTVTINVTDVNEAPSITAGQIFSIVENQPNGTVLGTLLATDPDTTAPNKTLTYSIVSGNNLNAFAINAATGQITVNNSAALNFETTTQFVLQVQVVDGANPSLSATSSITINVLNANETPTIPSGQTFSISENSANNTVVGTVSATDPDTTAPNNTLTYSITGGNTGNAFTINTATGQIRVANVAALNFENTPSFTLQINVTDGGSLSATQTVAITVNDVNEAPIVLAGQSFTVAERASVNTVVGTVNASDPDAAPNNVLGYSLTGGNVDGAFAINAQTGQITVANSAPLNFASNATFSLEVSVSDGALTTTQTVTVSLADVNEAPVITAGQILSVPENPSTGLIVGTVAASDPDPTLPNNTLTYSIVGGNLGNAFLINSTTGQITVSVPTAVNFEVTPQYTLQLKVIDGANPALSDTKTVTIAVGDVNEGPAIPANQAFSIPENAALNDVVGTVDATDPDKTAPNNTLSFSIVSGNTNGALTIDSTTGQLTVSNPAALDFQTTPTLNLVIMVTDAGNLSASQAVTVHVTEVNDAPVLANSGDVPVYDNHLGGSIVVLPNITVTDSNGSTDLAQVLISLPTPAGKKNPDVLGIAGASALGAVTDNTAPGRRQISITLNAGVTTAQVQAFLRSITFATKGKGLKLNHRDFQVQVVDRQGAVSNTITQDITVTRRVRAPKSR